MVRDGRRPLGEEQKGFDAAEVAKHRRPVVDIRNLLPQPSCELSVDQSLSLGGERRDAVARGDGNHRAE